MVEKGNVTSEGIPGDALFNDDMPIHHFTLVPHLIDDADLTPQEYRLYLHIKRVAGENNTCWQSENTLATACHISEPTIRKAKRQLQDKGFIRVEPQVDETNHVRHIITIVNIWEQNHAVYSKQGGWEKVEGLGKSRPRGESFYPGSGKSRPPKNTPYKNTPLKEIRNNKEKEKGNKDTDVSSFVSQKPEGLEELSEEEIDEILKETSASKKGRAKRSVGSNAPDPRVASLVAKVYSYASAMPEYAGVDPIQSYGQECAGIKRILNRGFSEDEIFNAWKALVDKKHEYVGMQLVGRAIKKEAKHEDLWLYR